MKRLTYVPLEAYKARSTEYMSVLGGVYETCFQKAGIDYLSIRPFLNKEAQDIKTGVVIDTMRRSEWGYSQCLILQKLLINKQITPENDVIYFEDFWTPGFEMIPYTQSILYGPDPSNHVPVFSFCHAQTVDPYDFTYPWRDWMRPMELGWCDYQKGIIVACKEMIGQMIDARWPIHLYNKGVEGVCKVHSCGLAFDAATLFQKFLVSPPKKDRPRANRVVFSSRFDSEKNPDFFIELAKQVIIERNDIEFCFATGASEVKSNNKKLIDKIEDAIRNFDRITLYKGLSKASYFRLLQDSRVQFNCADQDYISYSLLDATINNCAPLYPNYLTFPDALENNKDHLYEKGNCKDAKEKLYNLIDNPHGDYTWVYKKYESSVDRMLKAMEVI